MSWSLTLFVAIAASAAQLPAASAQRPTHAEWDEAQANATEMVGAKAAREAKLAAVNKVVTMLEGVKAKVLAEGESEAATYNKFSCFCKDTMTEKSEAIQKGEDEKVALTAAIEEKDFARTQLDEQIQRALEDIAAAELEMKEAEATRAKELALYTSNEADLEGALYALEGAIKTLKASKEPSLLQFQAVSKTVRTAIMLADALQIGGAAAEKAAAIFLQQAPDVPMQNYNFHSDGIIETLEKLLNDFRAEKVEVDKAEVSAVAQHTTFMQEKINFVKELNHEIEGDKKKKAEVQENIATASQELTTVAATLLDDQAYLKTLASICHDKALTWDQRTKLRQDELSTLTEVIGIISTSVSSETTAATIRFAQQGVSLRIAQAIARSDDAMEAVEADAEAAESSPIGFLQRRQVKQSRRPPSMEDSKKMVIDLLRSKGSDLKSTLLTTLASKISADPFAKVKQLIQELIERLLQEAANEATQKGWCDKAISDASQKRDYAAEEIVDLNGKMAELEATRDKLIEELEVLAEEIATLKSDRAKAEKERAEEKAENAVIVEEAQQGITAIDTAIDILSKFYKTAAKATVDLSLTQGPAEDAPDAGFEVGQAYTGAQGESGGILGMMEVIKSDFTRTVVETEEAEAKAEQDHLAFMTETGSSLAEKTVAEQEKTTQKDNAEESLATADENLQQQTVILETSIKELIELKPACIDTGMSYDERVSRREEEIKALNQALCILEAYQKYGPDGLSDAC